MKASFGLATSLLSQKIYTIGDLFNRPEVQNERRS